MTQSRTHLVALFARNALIVLLVSLLSRPAVASIDPPRPVTSPPSAADLPNAPAPHDGEPTSLHITILDGEGALNNIRVRTAREPIIQVEDENHKPVAGVLILLNAHSVTGGANASFNGLSTLTVKTGQNGQAIAHGFKPNAHVGNFSVDVTATYGNLVATAIIHQENVAGGERSNSDSQVPPPVNHHRVIKWAIAGGIIIGVTLILILDHNSGTNIGLGGGGVGHP